MSRKRNPKSNQFNKEKEIRERIAQKTKRNISILSLGFIAPCVILLFKIGESIYPSWVITNRTQIIGILILCITVIILSAPLVIEVSSNSRKFSSRNKNPYIDPWD
jgi:cytochrome bd-type quinol oxidase subunit 2